MGRGRLAITEGGIALEAEAAVVGRIAEHDAAGGAPSDVNPMSSKCRLPLLEAIFRAEPSAVGAITASVPV